MPASHNASAPAESASARQGATGNILRTLWLRVDVQSTAVLMLLAILVGAGTALVAVAFIRAIGLVNTFSFDQGLPQLLSFLGPAWIILVPILGSLISGPMIAYWAREAKGHGVPEVLQALILRGGRIRPRVAAVKAVASTFCIGTGGSAGREGPIVQVGSALGSTAAQLLRLGPERTITLVACGGAAGIAATFNAPIAGVIFAMEVLLGEFTTHYFGMVVVSAVAASVVSRHFLGSNPAFTIPSYSLVSASELPFYVVLGVLAAVVGWAFVGILYYAEDRFDGWRVPEALKPALGAIGVGITGLLFRDALGTGLPGIGQALAGTLPLTLLLALVFAKLVATTFTLGSGNSGGIFSPSLFMGAMLGGAFGSVVHQFFPGFTAGSGAYALVGMAAVFSAAAHAPLTASLIVFEMSGDYRMILPLMITVGLSTLISQYLRPHSIYTLKLVRRHIPLERDREVDLMRGLKVEEVMTREPDVIYGDAGLSDLAAALDRTHHHGFPVLDREGHLLGVVTYEDLAAARARNGEERLTVAEITSKDFLTVFPQDPLSKALLLMGGRGLGHLPVVAPGDRTRLVGLLRRENIISAYQRAMQRKMESHHLKESSSLAELTRTETCQIPVTPDMAVAGRQIRELRLPRAVLIVGVRRGAEVLIPNGDTVLQAGDTVVALAQREAVNGLHTAFTEPRQPAQHERQ